jgi:hypothetical protein
MLLNTCPFLFHRVSLYLQGVRIYCLEAPPRRRLCLHLRRLHASRQGRARAQLHYDHPRPRLRDPRLRLEQVRRLLHSDGLRGQDHQGLGRQELQGPHLCAQWPRLRGQEGQVLAAPTGPHGFVLLRHDGVLVGLYAGGRARGSVRSPHGVRSRGRYERACGGVAREHRLGRARLCLAARNRPQRVLIEREVDLFFLFYLNMNFVKVLDFR